MLPTPPPAQPISRLRKLRVAELRELLEGMGASTEGKKEELVQRLHAVATGGVEGGNAAKPLESSAAAGERAAAPSRAAAAGGVSKAEEKAPERLVMQFLGLGSQCDVGDCVGDDMEAAVGAEGNGDDVDEAEDGLIMAEAWLNVHLNKDADAIARR